MRISRDALYNIHPIVRDSSNQFIHAMHMFPNIVVIYGHSLTLDELEKVLYFDTIEQCLRYDMTFQLGDFYVSALIFRHIIFREYPCMPALFLYMNVKRHRRYDTIGKPLTTTHDPAGPDWLQIVSISIKDEEKSILHLPNAWLNDRKDRRHTRNVETTISPHMEF